MNFGFFTDQDSTRYCYLRLRRLKEAIKNPKILEALTHALEITDENLTMLSPGKMMASIERRIELMRATKTSIWYGVAAPEVLAASIFKAERLAADGTVQDLFNRARREQDLAAPVLTWLKGSGLTTVTGIPFGAGRVDFAGYRKGALSGTRVVAVQARNEISQLRQALDGMNELVPYTNATYLACTPAMAAEYLATVNVRGWDAEALRRKLQASGSALLIVERDAVSQALFPKERHLDLKKVDEFVANMTTATTMTTRG